MNRRAFLRTGANITAILLARPAWCADKTGSEISPNEQSAAAKEQIEKYRQSTGRIVARDAAGKPVAGAKVLLRQTRHDFLFGCNLFMWGRCGEPEREEQYRRQFAALFNYCTLGFYWSGYEFVRGQPNYAYTDQVLEWTREQDITAKGHPLVWDSPASAPRWLPDDPKEIAQLSNARVRDIVTRFKDRIDLWDVVNEATHLLEGVNKTKMAAMGNAVGQVPYVAEPLKIARAANPSAILLVNDYRTDPPYYRLLEKLREDGRPLYHTVGIQSHMHGGAWSAQKTREICDRYARLGLPLHFTETTIVSGPRLPERQGWGQTTPEEEERQAEATVAFYTTLFAHPAVRAITWWDFSDRGAWQRAPAGWLRQDMAPKPVYERMLKLVKEEWWTRVEGRTDATGEFATRAFYGDYQVTVEPAGAAPINRKIRWQRDAPNRFEYQV